MNNQFRLGAFLGSILLGQLELLLIALVMVGGLIVSHDYPEWSILGNLLTIISIGMILIFVVGHVKAVVGVMRDVNDPTVVDKEPDPPKNLGEALDIMRQPVTHGVIWRFKQEVKFIKQVFSFNFSYKD